MKTELFILSLGGATHVINFFSMKLANAFRTKQHVPEFMQNESTRFEDVSSQRQWPRFVSHPVYVKVISSRLCERYWDTASVQVGGVA